MAKNDGTSVRRTFGRRTAGDWVFDIIIYLSLAFVVLVTLYPFWNTVVVSFNDGLDSIKGGVQFWPRKFTMQNYKSLFTTDAIPKAFLISVSRTVLQTVLNIFCTTILAYALSRKEFVLKKPLTLVLVISMYINAGLIPGYMLTRDLGLLNKYSVYIIPCMVDVFNFILVRTYISGLSDSFIESARIDGANEFTIYWNIIMPLIVPSIAMVALFVAVNAWSSWFDTYLYCSGIPDLHSLQYKLMEYLNSSMNQSNSAADAGAKALAAASGSSVSQVTPISIRASITMIATVPILIVYPFLQKYFVAGITIGGVKE
ncbi:MAG: carbohydrate ABC transporter permease [Treponema sp.]|nr:carbohydrate ABC transporter permease [Treponema sp.]